MSKQNANLESEKMHSVQNATGGESSAKTQYICGVAKVEIKVSIERLIHFFFDLKSSHSIFKYSFLQCNQRRKAENDLHIGVWTNRHRCYLKQYHRIKY